MACAFVSGTNPSHRSLKQTCEITFRPCHECDGAIPLPKYFKGNVRQRDCLPRSRCFRVDSYGWRWLISSVPPTDTIEPPARVRSNHFQIVRIKACSQDQVFVRVDMHAFVHEEPAVLAQRYRKPLQRAGSWSP